MYILMRMSEVKTMTHTPLQAQQNERDFGSARLWWATCLCLGASALAIWMLNGNALFVEMITSAWALCF